MQEDAYYVIKQFVTDKILIPQAHCFLLVSILLFSVYSFLFHNWTKIRRNNWSNILSVILINFVGTYLSKIDRQVDFVVLHSSGKWWWLPPGFHPVDCIFWRMPLFRIVRITVIAYLDIINNISSIFELYWIQAQKQVLEREEYRQSIEASIVETNKYIYICIVIEMYQYFIIHFCESHMCIFKLKFNDLTFSRSQWRSFANFF